MIDTLVIGWPSDIPQIPGGMEPAATAEGRPQRYGVSRAGGALYVTYEPYSRLVTVRISVPAWAGRQRLNWPLRHLPLGVESLNLPRLAGEVGQAIGVRVSGFGRDGLRRIPLPNFAVINVHLAVDLDVPDPVAVVRLCGSIPRQHGGGFQAWASSGRPLSTVQWGKGARRTQIYAKGPALEALGEDEAAVRARRVLRVEARFGSPNAVRRGFLPTDAVTILPSMATVCHPRTVHRVLRREVERLRFFEDLASELTAVADGLPNRIRRLDSVIEQARDDLREGRRERVGRLRSITQERFSQYVTAYALVAGGFSQREVSTKTGWSPRVVSEIVRDLHAMGFPPDNGYTGQHIEVMRELQGAIPQWLRAPPADAPVDVGEWTPTVSSPWAADDGVTPLERSRLAGEAAIAEDRAREDPDSDTFTAG